MSHDRPALQLHLLRHADAGDPEAWTGPDDARPLSAKGEQQAERLATFLHGVRFRTDAVVTSPKLRARQTAEIVADGLGVAVTIDGRLAANVRPATVDEAIAGVGGPTSIVIVGHDPDFSELLATLTGSPGMSMKKGAIARLDVRGRVAEGRATLRWLIPPELLDRDRR